MRYYADSLRGLLDELGIRRIFLLGHSTGGVVAQEFYGVYPQYVRALILADTRYLGSRSTLEERLKAIRSKTPAGLALQRAPKLLTRGAPPELVNEVREIMAMVRPAGYEFAARALAECDTRDILQNLRVPVLLIWGAEDEITPMWNELPVGARLKVISGAGHLCYIEQAEEFNAIVREFLSEDHSSGCAFEGTGAHRRRQHFRDSQHPQHSFLRCPGTTRRISRRHSAARRRRR
jgi:pimeloyl-ACP methyl ester carboxylesterase